MITFSIEPNEQGWRRHNQGQAYSNFKHAICMTMFSVSLLLLGGATIVGGQSRSDILERSTTQLKAHIRVRENAQSSNSYPERSRSRKAASGWLYVLDSNNMGREAQILLVDPLQGQVVRTFKTDSLPDMALSPDGTRLYVASTRYSEDGNSRQDFLTVIDTKNGAVLAKVMNPDRWLSTGRKYPSMMAFSKDGRWLYIFKHLLTPQVDTYYVTAFDVKKNRFLREKFMLSGCVSGMLVPFARRGQLAVTCNGTQDLRFVELGGEDAIPNSTNTDARAARNRISLSSRDLPEHGRRIAAIIPAPDGASLTAIIGDGRYVKIDSESHQVSETGVVDRDARAAASGGLKSANNQQTDWLADSWMRWQTPQVSPDGERLYLGVGRLIHLHNGVQSFDRIAVFDSKSLNRLATIRTSQPFESLVLSPDGSHLYAISPEQAAIIVVDTTAQREVRTIYGIGTSPIWAVVAP